MQLRMAAAQPTLHVVVVSLVVVVLDGALGQVLLVAVGEAALGDGVIGE